MSLIRPVITILYQIEIIQLSLRKLLKLADHGEMLPIKAHEYGANYPKDEGLASNSIIALLLIPIRYFYVFRGPAHCETALRPRKYVLLHLTCMV